MPQLLFLVLMSTMMLLTACQREDNSFSGYVDAELVYLSSDFGGRLSTLAVRKGALVRRNQFLFKVDQTSELFKVELSELDKKNLQAQLQQLYTRLVYNKTNYQRIVGLRKQNAASQSDLDAAKRDLDLSEKEITALDVKILSNLVEISDRKWQVTRKENFAPEDGIVFDTYHTKDEFVPAGNPILSLVTNSNIKVIFFVPEKKLDKLRLNQTVKIKTNQNANFAVAYLSYISNIAEFTLPLIYSQEERQRLVFRVEANIANADLEKIHLGQPVTLELG